MCFLSLAFALKCWECNSNNNGVCAGDKLPDEMLKDCDPSFKTPVCLKLASPCKLNSSYFYRFQLIFKFVVVLSIQLILAFGYVRRDCRENNATASVACDEARIHDKDVFCGTCQSDQCNLAPSHYGSALLIAIPIAIMQLLSR